MKGLNCLGAVSRKRIKPTKGLPVANTNFVGIPDTEMEKMTAGNIQG
jgi:hypothetical protein